MLTHRHTHIAHCCSVLLKISWNLLCRMELCVHTCIHTHMYTLPTALPMSSAENFCDIPLLTPFFKHFGCMQHRWGMGISCSTGTLGWSSTVASSTSCFLSSCRRSPIYDYLQYFITVVPKLWHCSSAGDLHSCSCCSLVSRCTPVLTWKSSTVWPYFTAVGALGTSALLPGYIHWGMDVTGRGQLLRQRNCPPHRHHHRRGGWWYWGAEIITKSCENFLHFQLSIIFPSRTVC